MRIVQDGRVGERLAQERRQRIKMVILNQESARAYSRGANGGNHAPVCFQITLAPRAMTRSIQGRVTELSNQMMLQHPQHFIADSAVVRLVNPGGQRHRYYVMLRIGLVRGSGEQSGPGFAGAGWFGYAAKPGHIRAAGKRIDHAHQAAGRRLWDPPILLPNEIVRPAVGDQDDSSHNSIALELLFCYHQTIANAGFSQQQ